jgi:chorismate mutase
MARPKTNAPRPLEAIRGEIDAIDDRILELVVRRAALAEEVRQAKTDHGAAALRPAREGQMLRRLAGRPRGQISVEQLWRLWRELIMANARLQFPLTVDTVAGTRNLALWDMGRAHFCFETEMCAHDDACAALAALGAGGGRVALLPFGEAAWWRGIKPGGPRVFGVLPMIAQAGEEAAPPRAALVGEVALSDGGADATVLRAVGDGVGTARLDQVLDRAGLDQVYRLTPEPGVAIVGVAGFLPTAPSAPAPLPALSGQGLAVSVLGAHARALSARELP